MTTRPPRSGLQRYAAIALASVLAALSLVLAVAAAVLGGERSSSAWRRVVIPVLWVIPGLLVILGRAANPLGWLLLAAVLSFAASAFGLEWVHSGRTTAASWSAWVVDRASAIVVPLALAILLLLPTGSLPSRRWRPVAAAALTGQSLVVLVWAFAAGPVGGPDSDLPAAVADRPNPVGFIHAGWMGWLAGLDFWLLQVPLLLGVAACLQRLRVREDRQRLAGVLTAAIGFVLITTLGHALWPAAADVFDILGSGLLAAALTSAVLRRRLPGVDFVVSHALVYALFTAVIAAAYVLVVAALGQLGADLPPFGVGVVTATLALVLLPLRTRVQRFLDRVMYGDTRAPGRAVLRLAHNVADAGSLDIVMTGLARTATASLKAPWACVRVGERQIDHGTQPATGRTETAPLVVGDRAVGSLSVALPAHRSFGRHEQEVLTELATHGAQAIRAVQLADELRASRQQLVTAREAERSRLRRDLHDEIGPTLAGLAMQLAGLEELIRTDPVTATQRVPRLEQAAREALGYVRRTARGLRPPALDEVGLVGALEQTAHDVGVRLVARPDDRSELPCLPPAVEIAAYRIATEAITNVAHHSGVTDAELTAAVCDGELVIRVADQGQGRNGSPAGVGFLGMRERAAELGGRLDLRTTSGGGTTVEARLPLALPIPE